jgi:hypothetical protein
MQVYENRNQLYLTALAQPKRCFHTIATVLETWFEQYAAEPGLARNAQQLLALDAKLCPRTGSETTETTVFDFDADAACRQLGAMEIPAASYFEAGPQQLQLHHPGGVGDILKDADGGSWLRGEILQAGPREEAQEGAQESVPDGVQPVDLVAIA